MTTRPTTDRVVLVNPADINLADAKRVAADHDTTVEGNRFVPRGQVFLVDAESVRLPPHSTGGA